MRQTIHVSSQTRFVRPIEANRQLDSLAMIARQIPPVVYFARADVHPDLIKIGHTTNLSDRMHRYGGWHCLLAFTPGSRADERAMHRRFAEHLAEGLEWFYPADEILDLITELQAKLGVRS